MRGSLTAAAPAPRELTKAPEHVRLTGIVVEDVRVLYVPVPKAATTSILSALARVAGLDLRRRLRSRKLEVTRSQTIHDGSLWGPEHRLGARDEEELGWILGSDDWFRFTVVREPVRRLWSAWVSKVLVRDPRFLAAFGEDWFPPAPTSATDVLASFRTFVSGLPTRPDWSDSHWSSQADLIAPGVEWDVVGRLEDMDGVARAVAGHLGAHGATLPRVRNENQSFLPFTPALFDEAAYDACLEWTARDCDAFGYEPLAYAGGDPDPSWHARVEEALPMIRAITERNVRFLDLWRIEDESSSRKGTRRARAAIRALAGSLHALRGF